MVILVRSYVYSSVYYTIDLIRDTEFVIPAQRVWSTNHLFFSDIWTNLDWKTVGDGKNLTFVSLPGFPSNVQCA